MGEQLFWLSLKVTKFTEQQFIALSNLKMSRRNLYQESKKEENEVCQPLINTKYEEEKVVAKHSKAKATIKFIECINWFNL